MADPTSYVSSLGLISSISVRTDFAKEKRLAQVLQELVPPLDNPGSATHSSSYK